GGSAGLRHGRTGGVRRTGGLTGCLAAVATAARLRHPRAFGSPGEHRMHCKRLLLAWALAAWLPLAAHAQAAADTVPAEPAATNDAAPAAATADTCPAIALAGADAAAVTVPSAPDAWG